jgi:hypothetical protein
LRKWFPKRYCLMMLKRTETKNKEKLRAAQGLSLLDRRNLRAELDSDIWEWQDWLREIEDAQIVAQAPKMDVFLDEIPVPVARDARDSGHYTIGSFGNRHLRQESREALVTKIRERGPAYRRERREVIELWIKAGTVTVGILGAATGLVAFLKK